MKILKMSLSPSSLSFISPSYFSFLPIIVRPVALLKAGPIITERRARVSDWARRHVDDPYVRQSVKDGYRCRSAYKLLQIEDKFKIFKPGYKVMECGCAPGSWSQVSAKLVNAGGLYDPKKRPGCHVGCDLLYVQAVPGAVLLPRKDFTKEDTQKDILEAVGNSPFNVVISDMAPNASGHKSLDHERIMGLAGQVKDFTLKHGTIGTSMIIKIWHGGLTNSFLDLLKNDFINVKMFKPAASRNDSAEVYIIAMDLVAKFKND